MKTTKSSTLTKSNTNYQSFSIDGWFKKQVAKFENARFGWMTIYITAQSCLGAIAVMYVLQNNANDILLSISAAITMASNALFIAQAPGKWCLITFYLSVLINALIILFNI